MTMTRAEHTAYQQAVGSEQTSGLGPVLIEARDVTKAYRAGMREVEILHRVSLGVRAGEMCAVMGPSVAFVVVLAATVVPVLRSLREPAPTVVARLVAA